METKSLNVSQQDIIQLKRDVALIKNILLDEGELTEWAKKELEIARSTPKSKYIETGEIAKEFLQNAT